MCARKSTRCVYNMYVCNLANLETICDNMCVHAVWGLGCTILECLSGAPVFNGRPDARCRYTDVSETACCEAPDSSQMYVD